MVQAQQSWKKFVTKVERSACEVKCSWWSVLCWNVVMWLMYVNIGFGTPRFPLQHVSLFELSLIMYFSQWSTHSHSRSLRSLTQSRIHSHAHLPQGSKRPDSGIVKVGASMFSSPADVEGKVGVVNSGRGMTDFSQRKKHKFETFWICMW